MIDYKHPTIASWATPIRSAGRAPNEELFWEDNEENFESIVGGKHQKVNSTFHSHRESGFKNSTTSAIALAKSKIEEIEVWRSQRLKKSKISRSQSYMKSKIEAFEDWRSQSYMKSKKHLKIEEVKDRRSQSLETQPESATRVESRGLLTWVCPSGTHRLVYRVRPIMKVDKYKDSTRLT
jgi:hypothetical protein